MVLRQHLEHLKTRRFNKVTLPRLSRKVRTSLDIHSIAVYLDHEVYTKNANGGHHLIWADRLLLVELSGIIFDVLRGNKCDSIAGILLGCEPFAFSL